MPAISLTQRSQLNLLELYSGQQCCMMPGHKLLGFSHFYQSRVVLLMVSLLHTVSTDISDVCMDCIVKVSLGQMSTLII